ncbi:unnamed protein product, partial [marine sediment metagenome]
PQTRFRLGHALLVEARAPLRALALSLLLATAIAWSVVVLTSSLANPRGCG